MNLLSGFTGLIPLMYAGLAGIGAYVTVNLVMSAGVSFWLAMPLGAVAAAYLLRSIVPISVWDAVHLGTPSVAPDLTAAQAGYFKPPAYLLLGQAVMVLVTATLALRDRGTLAQALFFASTTLASVFVLGVYGFVVMERANPFLRNVAVAQWLMVMVCLLWNTVLDVLVFRGAETAGGIRWGRMPARSQYTLILLCVTIVMLMGLMGFIRSGLREDWHVYGVLQDTSPWAWTPTTAYMTRVVGAIVLGFLGLVAFVFWLAGLGGSGMTVGVGAGEGVAALVAGGEHPLAGLLSPARAFPPMAALGAAG